MRQRPRQVPGFTLVEPGKASRRRFYGGRPRQVQGFTLVEPGKASRRRFYGGRPRQVPGFTLVEPGKASRRRFYGGRPRQVRGFTLVELAVSISIMAVLTGAMMSVVLVASRALPDDGDPSQRTAEAVQACEMLAADLATAIAITQATSSVIEFTVPDRGHGAVGPETIRYAWSGTPGDPLTRQYNGGTAVAIAAPVQAFSIAWVMTAGALGGPPRVLLVSSNPGSPSARETATSQAMRSWGFAVQSIADNCTPAQFATALQSADVVYILPETTLARFGDKLTNMAKGVVIADTELYAAYGVASSNGSTSAQSIFVALSSHPVMNGYSLGSVQICSTTQSISLGWSLASGATWLATAGFIQSAMFCVDWDGPLTAGASAGRRVAVPSGTTSFDFTKLTSDGARLERNAIVWAAAPKVIAGVTLTLQVGADASGGVVSDVQLLNQPKAP